MSFLDKLGDAADWLGEKTLGSATSAAKVVTLPVGALVDTAKWMVTDDDDFSWTKGAAGAGRDFLIGNGTLTGWTFSTAGKGLDAAYQGAIDNPVDAAVTFAHQAVLGDPISWSQAWDAAQSRSLGQGTLLALNETTQAIGEFTGAGGEAIARAGQVALPQFGPLTGLARKAGVGSSEAAGIDAAEVEAWNEFHEISPFWSGVTASAIDFTAMWFADPFVVGAKATKGAREINRLMDSAERERVAARTSKTQKKIAEFLPGGSSRVWDKRIDDLVGTTKAEPTGVIDDDGVHVLRAVTDNAGWLDGKSASEIYVGLRLDDLPASQGQTLASLLARTDGIEDAAARVNVRRDIIAATNGDAMAMKRLSTAERSYASELSNAMTARGTGSIDAMFRDMDNAAAIDAGQALPSHSAPDVLASLADDLANNDAVRDAVFASMRHRTLRASSAGERALARQRRQGLGRDGTLHTGFAAVDNFVSGLTSGRTRVADDGPVTDRALRDSEAMKSAEPSGLAGGSVVDTSSTTILNHATSMPWTVVKKIGYYGTVGVPLRLGARLSDSLRGKQTVSGALPVEDSHAGLVYSVMQDRYRRAGVNADAAKGFLDELVQATNPTERSLAVQKIEDHITSTVAKKYGVSQEAAETLAKRIRRNQDMTAQVWAGQRYSAQKITLADGAGDLGPRPLSGERGMVPSEGSSAPDLPSGPSTRTTFNDTIIDYDDAGGIIITDQTAPILSTQTPNHIMLHDIGHMERWLKVDRVLAPTSRVRERFLAAEADPDSLVGQAQAMGLSSQTAAVRDLGVMMSNGLDAVNGFWKRSVLGQRVISYLTRNTAEEQLRIAATGQLGASLRQASRQGAFDAKNWVRLSKNPHVKYEEAAERMTTRHVLADEADMYREILDDPSYQERIDGILAEIQAATDAKDADRLAFLRSMPELQQWKMARERLVSTEAKVKAFDEWFEATAKSDSRPVEIPGYEGVNFRGAFEGQAGARNSTKLLGGSQLDYETMGVADRTYGFLRGMDGDGIVHAPPVTDGYDTKAAKRWLNNWHWVLNKQIAQADEAQVALRSIAAGDDEATTAAKLLEFLSGPEGRRTREMNPTRVKRGGLDAQDRLDDWAWTITRTVRDYVPSTNLAEALTKGPVDVADLRRDFLNPDKPIADLPSVHRAGIDALLTKGGNMYERAMGRMLRKADELGPQMWSRHPMFAVHYYDEQIRLADRFMELKRATDGDAARFTSKDLDELQRRASAHAHKQIQDSFYDATTRSSAAQAMKWVYPFFAAHQDSLKFWSKMFAKDPSTLRRLQQGFAAPAHLGLVVDYEGNVVEPGTYPDESHRVLLQVPAAWGGPDPKDPTSKGLGWSIPLSSLNLMVQSGSLINPGAGPMASIPAGWVQSEIGSSNEDVSKMMRWFNPFGAPTGQTEMDAAVGTFLPTPARRVLELLDEEKRQATNYYGFRLQEAQIKFYEEHGRPPNKVESNDLVKRVGEEVKTGTLLRVFGSIVSPSQPAPTSKVQGLLSEFRRLQEKERTENLGSYWATNKFLDEYGEQFIALTKSGSEYRINSSPSHGTVGALKANKSLVDSTDPRVWSLIVGPEDDGEFATDAYRWLQRRKAGQGTSDSVIDSRNPASAVFNVNVAAGYREYSKMTDMLDLAASQYGYPSWSKSPELKMMRSNALRELAAKYPDWWAEFQSPVKDYEASVLTSLEAVAKNRKLASDPARPEVALVGEYVEARRLVDQILAQRKASGGSGSMTAQANGDIALAFAQYIEDARLRNIQFNDYAFIGLIEKDPYYIPEILEVTP